MLGHRKPERPHDSAVVHLPPYRIMSLNLTDAKSRHEAASQNWCELTFFIVYVQDR